MAGPPKKLSHRVRCVGRVHAVDDDDETRRAFRTADGGHAARRVTGWSRCPTAWMTAGRAGSWLRAASPLRRSRAAPRRSLQDRDEAVQMRRVDLPGFQHQRSDAGVRRMVMMLPVGPSGREPDGPGRASQGEQRCRVRGQLPRVVDRGRGVQPREPRRQTGQGVLGLGVARHEIAAGDRDAVRHRDLPPRFVMAIENLVALRGRYDGQNPAEAHGASERGCRHERIEDRAGVGEAGRLDHDPIERDRALAPPRQQLLDRGQEIAAGRATDATRRQKQEIALHRRRRADDRGRSRRIR